MSISDSDQGYSVYIFSVRLDAQFLGKESFIFFNVQQSTVIILARFRFIFLLVFVIVFVNEINTAFSKSKVMNVDCVFISLNASSWTSS